VDTEVTVTATGTETPPAVTVIVWDPADSVAGIVAEVLREPLAPVVPVAITTGVEVIVTVNGTPCANVPAAQEMVTVAPAANAGGVTVHPPVGGYWATAAGVAANATKEQTPTATTHRNSRMTIATFRPASADTLRSHSNTGSHEGPEEQ
jgi:hypothetical protein